MDEVTITRLISVMSDPKALVNREEFRLFIRSLEPPTIFIRDEMHDWIEEGF